MELSVVKNGKETPVKKFRAPSAKAAAAIEREVGDFVNHHFRMAQDLCRIYRMDFAEAVINYFEGWHGASNRVDKKKKPAGVKK